jgi:MshEN domain
MKIRSQVGAQFRRQSSREKSETSMNQTLEMTPGDDIDHVDAAPDDAEASAHKPLGEMLVAGGLISEAQLDQALSDGRESGQRLGQVLIEHGWASEEEVARLLATQWGLDYVDRASIYFDSQALNRISREDAQRLEALPTRIDAGRVVVAVAEPSEQQIEELRQVIGEDPVLIVVPWSALEAGLQSNLLKRGTDGDAVKTSGRARDSMPADQTAETSDTDTEALETEEAEEAEEAPAPSALPRPLPEDVIEFPLRAAASHEIEGLDSVAALAAQARGVADLIAAQAESMREEASTYNGRIAELESELAAERRALAEVKRHLEAAVRAIGGAP